ncbi:MAG: DUF2232 domain-containing protein [Deltaproteobacteria bacterium]|nr:DUF2232 domain-containing protein [Deltaproteobacteria bacterium]
MPLETRGRLLHWPISWAFLFLCIVVVILPMQALPLTIILPAVYCLWSERFSGLKPFVISLMPALLMVYPPFMPGTLLYLAFVVCGFLLSLAEKKRFIGLAIFVPSVLLGIIFILSICILAHKQSMNLAEFTQVSVSHMMDEVTGLYAQMVTSRDMMEFKMNRTAIENRILRLSPAILVSGFTFVMWLNLIITAAIKRNIRLIFWKSPDWVLFVFVCTALCYVMVEIAHVFQNQILGLAALNIFFMALQAYFFQGIAIVGYFFDVRNWNKIFRWLIYLLIFSQVYIMILVIGLGLFDVWFDFRKRMSKLIRR